MKKQRYSIRKLIEGQRLGKDGWLVAVPNYDFNTKIDFEKLGEFEVEYQGEVRVFNWKESVTFRIFDDKAGRGKYTLGYFKWL